MEFTTKGLNMRVLHITKTADFGVWAAAEAAELVKLGVEIHVALPRAEGRSVKNWVDAGAVVHVAPTDLPVHSPWSLRAAKQRIRDLVASICPDLIHSHFFGSTILLRLALGSGHSTPRIYQVAGPQVLENRFWRMLELSTAADSDYWIASSRCILSIYRAAGVPEKRLYLSYYGMPMGSDSTARTGLLRKRYGIADQTKVVGNANFIYPPKRLLGQTVGPKAHEDVIDALGLVVRQRPDVIGVLIGGTISGSLRYERRLRARAETVGNGRIIMTGFVPSGEIRQMWPDFDVAVHTPTTENCGGVIEPLLAGVPTIAGRIGGLPEVVIEGYTGRLVGIRNPHALAQEILNVLDRHEHYCRLAKTGGSLVRTMFDVRRTAREVFKVYRNILHTACPAPPHFDSLIYLQALLSK
jgi:glycosyltransferase involved in cell wall biosynthesis